MAGMRRPHVVGMSVLETLTKPQRSPFEAPWPVMVPVRQTVYTLCAQREECWELLRSRVLDAAADCSFTRDDADHDNIMEAAGYGEKMADEDGVFIRSADNGASQRTWQNFLSINKSKTVSDRSQMLQHII